MISPEELNQLFWHSRRGMRELDVLLIPFVQEAFPQMTADDQALYKELLNAEDQDLFSWFMQREVPPTDGMKRIVDIVLDYARTELDPSTVS